MPLPKAAATVTTHAGTPDPSALTLIGTGIPGLASFWRKLLGR